MSLMVDNKLFEVGIERATSGGWNMNKHLTTKPRRNPFDIFIVYLGSINSSIFFIFLIINVNWRKYVYITYIV